jgi:hypothetical protein
MAMMLTEFAGTCNSRAGTPPPGIQSDLALHKNCVRQETNVQPDRMITNLTPPTPRAQQNCAFQPAAKTAMRRQRGGYVQKPA